MFRKWSFLASIKPVEPNSQRSAKERANPVDVVHSPKLLLESGTLRLSRLLQNFLIETKIRKKTAFFKAVAMEVIRQGPNDLAGFMDAPLI